jgi:hypothetical protein
VNTVVKLGCHRRRELTAYIRNSRFLKDSGLYGYRVKVITAVVVNSSVFFDVTPRIPPEQV